MHPNSTGPWRKRTCLKPREPADRAGTLQDALRANAEMLSRGARPTCRIRCARVVNAALCHLRLGNIAPRSTSWIAYGDGRRLSPTSSRVDGAGDWVRALLLEGSDGAKVCPRCHRAGDRSGTRAVVAGAELALAGHTWPIGSPMTRATIWRNAVTVQAGSSSRRLRCPQRWHLPVPR